MPEINDTPLFCVDDIAHLIDEFMFDEAIETLASNRPRISQDQLEHFLNYIGTEFISKQLPVYLLQSLFNHFKDDITSSILDTFLDYAIDWKQDEAALFLLDEGAKAPINKSALESSDAVFQRLLQQKSIECDPETLANAASTPRLYQRVIDLIVAGVDFSNNYGIFEFTGFDVQVAMVNKCPDYNWAQFDRWDRCYTKFCQRKEWYRKIAYKQSSTVHQLLEETNPDMFEPNLVIMIMEMTLPF
jgi:hypothetical protein